MSFFEDLTKKVTDAGQSAVNKTKQVAGVMKLNSQVSDEEKKIAGLYNEIGKLYAEKFGDTAEGEFAELIGKIKTAQSAIEDLKAQIEAAKAE